MDYELLGKMAVSIGEAAKISGIPIRKLRYWEDRGYIDSVEEKSNITRRFDYFTVKKIILMKELIEDGYTLGAASQKAGVRIMKIREVFEEQNTKR
ncbi:MerR family transcriptional regulator [Terribacillus saccharophilus]|uniref:MerR family transcriptional regulator n=1 Tax=Terribacillus saccharophilus TaxID=361277 RepID=UPI0039820B94